MPKSIVFEWAGVGPELPFIGPFLETELLENPWEKAENFSWNFIFWILGGFSPECL